MAGGKKGAKVGGSAGGFRIDASEFVAFCNKLADKMDASFGKIISHEVLKVLGTAAEKTKRTTLAKAGGKYNPGSRNFKGWVRMNGKFYYVGPSRDGKQGFRYSDSMWNRLMARLAMNRKRAEARVGLSQTPYYRAAHLLKLSGRSSAFDSRAKTPYTDAGGMGKDGEASPIWSKTITASKNLKGSKPYMKFQISSTNTFNPFIQGKGALQSALNGRERYFEHAVTDGWKATAKKVASVYPGIKVK